MMAVKGWGERELPEGHKWTDHKNGIQLVQDTDSIYPGRLSHELVERVLRVFAPDQIEDAPERCGQGEPRGDYPYSCDLIVGHDWPHVGRSSWDTRVWWGTNAVVIPDPDCLPNAPWFDGADDEDEPDWRYVNAEPEANQ